MVSQEPQENLGLALSEEEVDHGGDTSKGWREHSASETENERRLDLGVTSQSCQGFLYAYTDLVQSVFSMTC